jgi:type II secretory pathway component PulL
MSDPPTRNRPAAPAPPATAETLTTSLNDLLTQSEALRADVHAAETARRRATFINSVMMALLVVLVGLLVVVTWQNNRLTERVSETNARMADCTTPGGACYEDGRARTRQAISDVVRVSVFVAQCARLYPGEAGPEFDAKMEKCVSERLVAAQATPSVSPTPR